MFVKTTRVRRDNKTYEYLSLVEAVREGGKVGHRVLFRLGEAGGLRRSGELERIIAALRSHCADPAEGAETMVAASSLMAESAPAVGAVAAVAAVWHRLGLEEWFAKLGAERGAEVLEHAVFAMVANRLVAPTSKRRLPEWVATEVVAPAGFVTPSLEQYYRALDAVADAKAATETQLYATLTDLTNLDLRLVCYDLTSTYFEADGRASARFPSRAFGYSRDHRSDRPQVVIGLLCTGDGIPIAHHVFAGNTADVSTLPEVLADLQGRLGGRAHLCGGRSGVDLRSQRGGRRRLRLRPRHRHPPAPRPHLRGGPGGLGENRGGLGAGARGPLGGLRRDPGRRAPLRGGGLGRTLGARHPAQRRVGGAHRGQAAGAGAPGA